MPRKYLTKNGVEVDSPMHDGNMFQASTKRKKDFLVKDVLKDTKSSKEQKAIASAYLQGAKDESLRNLMKNDPDKYLKIKKSMDQRRLVNNSRCREKQTQNKGDFKNGKQKCKSK